MSTYLLLFKRKVLTLNKKVIPIFKVSISFIKITSKKLFIYIYFNFETIKKNLFTDKLIL